MTKTLIGSINISFVLNSRKSLNEIQEELSAESIFGGNVLLELPNGDAHNCEILHVEDIDWDEGMETEGLYKDYIGHMIVEVACKTYGGISRFKKGFDALKKKNYEIFGCLKMDTYTGSQTSELAMLPYYEWEDGEPYGI